MIKFGPWPISHNEIFFNSAHSYGIVNIKPVVPGHVLILPKRVCPRFGDLTPSEISDLFLSCSLVSKVIEKMYHAEAITMTIQDGPSAGQTVPHVHVHLIPRVKGDWMDNEYVSSFILNLYSEIYPTINGKEKELHAHLKKRQGPDDESRQPRTQDDMKQETDLLRVHFQSHQDIWSS